MTIWHLYRLDRDLWTRFRGYNVQGESGVSKPVQKNDHPCVNCRIDTIPANFPLSPIHLVALALCDRCASCHQSHHTIGRSIHPLQGCVHVCVAILCDRYPSRLCSSVVTLHLMKLPRFTHRTISIDDVLNRCIYLTITIQIPVML